MENRFERGAGVLCHISSLPNGYGIGSLGKEAYEFADFLKKSHIKYWQILPLVQTGFGDSPYQSVCCNSGNPYFIDVETLFEEGLLDEEELESCKREIGDVDYADLYNERYKILRIAYARFNVKDEEFVKFVEKGEFESYALFMSLKSRYTGSFDTFPDPFKYAENLAMAEFKNNVYKSEYLFWQFVQFEFFKQWKKLKSYVNSLGIKIIGDIPLYVAYDSADVWSHPELFMLDENLTPTEVAGVPPDYFSKTGQLWGNPIYNWQLMESDNYAWWVDRIRHAAEMYDIVRIDHFRGFDRYYAIPYGQTTAEHGEWKNGPKSKLFYELQRRLGKISVIAEDLGIMDIGVERLRAATGFPGMKIALFAFDGKQSNPYLPHNMEENCVAYTGTHDNATTLGLLKRMDESQFKTFKKRLRRELKLQNVVIPFYTREEAARALIVCTLASPADLAIIPIQDIVGLDDEARMNIPSTSQGNWQFRLKSQPTRYHSGVLRKIIKEYNR